MISCDSGRIRAKIRPYLYFTTTSSVSVLPEIVSNHEIHRTHSQDGFRKNKYWVSITVLRLIFRALLDDGDGAD